MLESDFLSPCPCSGSFFSRENLPDADLEAANSTAHAAHLLSESDELHVAAVGTSLAAEKYGLDIVAEGIEDHQGNKTRFVLIARDGIPAPTGHDKTSVVVFQQSDRPGSLLAILQEFAARSINLTKLESRPSAKAWQYCFFLIWKAILPTLLWLIVLKRCRRKMSE